jgi:hypothetical protein
MEVSVPEGERAPVRSHQPVARSINGGLMPTTGRCKCKEPVELGIVALKGGAVAGSAHGLLFENRLEA